MLVCPVFFIFIACALCIAAAAFVVVIAAAAAVPATTTTFTTACTHLTIRAHLTEIKSKQDQWLSTK